MTTAQGVPLSDDARGHGAHGRLETLEVIPELTRAALFQKRGTIIEAFVRFSTVAGNMGSPDLARDVRGFAVKLYMSEGNWDIVGNNMPVFFIQDASSSSTGSRAKACSRSSGTKRSRSTALTPTSTAATSGPRSRPATSPQWDLGVQVFDAEFADAFEFDVLDPTKLIPEEVVPVRIIARLTLDRVVDNVFAETESGDTRRIRAETFADHYSQASLFHRSQTPVEQQHITDAFAHHKFIGVGSAAGDLLAAAEGEADEGMVAVGDSADAAAFLELCQALRHWARDVLP